MIVDDAGRVIWYNTTLDFEVGIFCLGPKKV